MGGGGGGGAKNGISDIYGECTTRIVINKVHKKQLILLWVALLSHSVMPTYLKSAS